MKHFPWGMYDSHNVAGEVDHESLEQELTVSASLGRQCFNITIIDINVAEEDELSLTAIRCRAGKNIYQVLTPTATVTLIDDDCKSIKFHFNSPNVNQSV